MKKQKKLLSMCQKDKLKDVLVIIPARGGSKGLPNKNIKNFVGKPLIQYTIEAAREVFSDHCIVVSTDSLKIKEIVKQSTGLDVPFLRPANLAKDDSTSRDVVLHALNFFTEKYQYKPSAIVLLQPTSPLRNANNIRQAMSLYDSTIDLVVSVKKTDSNPYNLFFVEGDAGFIEKMFSSSFLRRQDCPIVYELNGAIYIYNPETFFEKKLVDLKIKKYLMDKENSVDIDDEVDWIVASELMKKKQKSDFA